MWQKRQSTRDRQSKRCRKNRRPRAKNSRRLWLERLEDRTMLSVSVSGVPSWVAKGPGPEANSGDENVPGELFFLGPNPVAGAMEALAVDPGNPKVVYAGGVNGGVWMTGDITAAPVAWTPLTDQFPSLQIASLQFDPSDASNQTVVAGIGQTDGLGNLGPLTGLLKTTNGGNTWTQLGNAPQDSGGLQGLSAGKVVPRGNTILVGTPQGVYRSSNGGSTFQNISGLNNLPDGGVFDLVGDPSNPDRVYVALGGASAGVFRSDDLGNQWTDLTGTAIGPTILAHIAGNMKLSVSAAAPNPVYWAIEGQYGLVGPGVIGLFRSENQGGQWTAMDVPETLDAPRHITNATGTPIMITTAEDLGDGFSEGNPVRISGVTGNTAANGDFNISRKDASGKSLPKNQFLLVGSASNAPYTGGGTLNDIQGINHGGQPWNFTLVADPNNANLVYIAGDAQGWTGTDSSIGANDSSARIFRGDFGVAPGGLGAVPSPQWAPFTNQGTSNDSSPHADSRAMVFDGGQLLLACDGGIFEETSPQDRNGQWLSKNGNLQVTEFGTVIAYDSISHIIFGGAQDTGLPQQIIQNSPVYTDKTRGDGPPSEVDDLTLANQSIRYFRFARHVYDSSNQEVQGKYIELIPAGGISGYKGFSFLAVSNVAPVDNQHSADVVIANGTNNSIFESSNAGIADTTEHITWSQIPTGNNWAGVNNLFSITAMALGGIHNGQINQSVLYAGSGNQIFLRTDANGTLNPTPGQPQGADDFQYIAMDPNDWMTAYATDGSQVFQTTDAGDHWTSITGNLTAIAGAIRAPNSGNASDSNLHALQVVDGSGVSAVLAGGSDGVFRMLTNNPGVWTRYGTAFPNASVWGLQYSPTDDVLVAGTLGRGAFEVQNASASLFTPGVLQINGDSDFPNENDTIKLVLDANNPLLLDVFLNSTVPVTRVPLSSLTQILVNGQGGDDRLIVDNSNGLITVQDLGFDGGSGTNSLQVLNQNDANPENATFALGQITGLGPGAILYRNIANLQVVGGPQQNTFTVTDNFGVATTIDTGNGDLDQVNVEATEYNGPVTINLGAGRDFVDISPRLQNVGNIIGAVTVHGGASALATLTVHDRNSSYTEWIMTAGGISANADHAAINYDRMDTVVVEGASAGYFHVLDTPAVTVTTINTGDGKNTVAVEKTTGPLAVNFGSGSNRAEITPTSKNLDNIQGALTINGGGFDNALIADDSQLPRDAGEDLGWSVAGKAFSRFYTVFGDDGNGNPTQTVVTATVNYSDIQTLDLRTNATAKPIYLSPDLHNLDELPHTHTIGLFTRQGSVTVHGGGSDTLILDDQQNSQPSTWLATGSNVTRSYTTGGTLFETVSAIVNYSGLANLVLNAGSGGNMITLSPTTQDLDELPHTHTIGLFTRQGSVTVHGGGSDTLILDDQQNSQPSTWLATGSNVTRSYTTGGTLFETVSAIVNYSELANLALNGGSGGNIFNVQSTAAGTTTTLSTQPGDTVNVGYNGSVQGILGALTVDAGGTTLVVDDSADPTARTVILTPTQITGLAPAVITYAGISNLTVDGGFGGNTIGVQNTAAGTNTTVNSGNGLDVVYVRGTTGPLTVNTQQGNAPGGGFGFDSVIVGALVPNVGFTLDPIQGALTVNTAQGFGNLGLYDTATTASEQFTVTNDTITRSGMAPISYVVTNELFIYLGSGGDNVTIPSISPGLLTVFSGGVGNDTVNVGDAANTLNEIQGHLTFAIANPGSRVILNDQGDTTPLTFTFATTLTGGGGGFVPSVARSNSPYLFFYNGPLQSLVLNTGSGGNTVNVQKIPSLTAVTINGSGLDTVNVGNPTDGVGDIQGPLNITNNPAAGGYTALTVADSADPTPRTVTITPTSITGLAPATITYSGISNLTVDGGFGGNTIVVQNTAAGTNTTVNSGNGVDTVYVEGTTGPLTVNTQQSSTGPGFGGFEAVYVGKFTATGFTMDAIQGALTVNTAARPGIDYGNLALYDNGATASENYTLTNNSFLRSGAAPIYYTVTNQLFAYLGSGGNTFNVLSTHPGLAYSIFGGVGNDTFNIGDANGTLNGIFYQLAISIQNPGSQVIVHDEGSSANYAYALASVILHPTVAINLPAYRILRSDWNQQGLGTAIWVTGPLYGTPPLPLQSLVLKAGSGNNTFNVQSLPPGNPTVTLDGGGGTNTIQGPNQTNSWQVTGPNAGTFDSSIKFSHVQNLIGGTANDTFAMKTGASLAGSLNGGGGTDTLDYAGYVGDVTVNLPLGTASAIAGGIANIQNVNGSIGNDLLVGDANPNVLIGGTGRNIIIGGAGPDQITGGGGDNILIGGTTLWDTNVVALQAIMQEWVSNASFDTRVNTLRKGITVNDQTYALNKSTVLADSSPDSLIGGAGQNWFFFDFDDVIDNGAGPGPNDRMTRV